MATHQTAAASAVQAEQTQKPRPARSDRRAGTLWTGEPPARERGKNLIKEFVSQVLDGSMTVSKDAEIDDQRADRADRPPAFAPAQ